MSGTTEWGQLIRAFVTNTVVNSALITAAFLSVEYFLLPIIKVRIENLLYLNMGGLIISILLSAPFIWALTLRRNRATIREALWTKISNRAPLIILELSRWVIIIALLGALSTHFISVRAATLMVVLVMALVLVLFSRHLDRLYSWFENRFITNLSEKENSEKLEFPLAPWDAHIATLEMPIDSKVVGKSLEELKVRERFGVTITLIGRGRRKVLAPNRFERLFPNDQIAIIGTDEQIAAFRALLNEGTGTDSGTNNNSSNYSLHSLRLEAGSEYVGRTIRDSGIREKCHGLVVGLEREGRRTLNPDSTIRLEPNDLLWIVADDKLFRQL